MRRKLPKVFYPGAIQKPLGGHSTPGAIARRTLIVLHITDGPTAKGAIDTFKASAYPNRVSAHFVIDRDGTVYQLLPLSNTAWHATAVNSISVGIEHAAIANTLLATPEQYSASAALVAWLCQTLSIPCDRQHIKTHNEASPRDGHVLCCTGALDPDIVVRLAVESLKSGAKK
jgi:N-acetyl-anhydromuramyl-L-alanine amidase AmpD